MVVFDIRKIKRFGIFDNGCANVVVRKVEVLNGKMITKGLIGEKDRFTAGYLKDKRGNVLVGESFVHTDYAKYKDSSEIAINFKDTPKDDNNDKMAVYLRAWNEFIRKNWQEYDKDEEGTAWFVGCPAQWTTDEIEVYRRKFEKAGFKNVFIIPESNAAILHHLRLNKGGKVDKELTTDLVKKALKIIRVTIDSGAYSNDATLTDGNKLKHIGSFVGSHIIDMMIVCANIYLDLDKKYSIKSEVNEKYKQEIRKLFEDKANEKFRSFMFLQGRWLKEAYFTYLREKSKDINSNDYNITDEVSTMVTINGKTHKLYVNTEMMGELLQETDIKELLGPNIFNTLSKETRDEIEKNKTWCRCYEAFIQNIVNSSGDLKEAISSGEKPIVILTGGAAEMQLLHNIVRNIFGFSVERDRTPLLSIADGLCDYGIEKLRYMAFKKVCDMLYAKTEKDENGNPVCVLYSCAEKAYIKSAEEIAERLAATCSMFVTNAKNSWLEVNFFARKIEYCTNIVYCAKMKIKNYFDKDLCEYFKRNDRHDEKKFSYTRGERYFYPYISDTIKDIYGEMVRRFGLTPQFELTLPEKLDNDLIVEKLRNNLPDIMSSATGSNLYSVSRFFIAYDENVSHYCFFLRSRRDFWKIPTVKLSIDGENFSSGIVGNFQLEDRFSELMTDYRKAFKEDIEKCILDESKKTEAIEKYISLMDNSLCENKEHSFWLPLIENQSE